MHPRFLKRKKQYEKSWIFKTSIVLYYKIAKGKRVYNSTKTLHSHYPLLPQFPRLLALYAQVRFQAIHHIVVVATADDY